MKNNILKNSIHETVRKEIITLEYLLKRIKTDDILIKNITQSIIEKLELLGFDLNDEQPHEYIQSLYDFNMLHEEYKLELIDEDRFNYWQSINHYNKFHPDK